ncbi:MAG: nucleotidyltransferase domain-containing protein [Candidatus Paraprevotella stercoravium]|uniref:Nucleotidyltransferase domain-containing protein n=1 Tax=Candidatus Paraprevotella stercoravium TaxID=2838725 RepID=A0A9E2L7Z3_9BACT|nr:nucleotidyltransferase domain-containing protein [Candidatus Paraprevotella stercoravium]
MRHPDIIKRISEVMHRIAPTAKTVLYGSEARGEAGPDSDIDLLILLEDSEQPFEKRKLEIARQLYEVELDCGVIISPHIVLRCLWEKVTTPFSINIQKEGIAL